MAALYIIHPYYLPYLYGVRVVPHQMPRREGVPADSVPVRRAAESARGGSEPGWARGREGKLDRRRKVHQRTHTYHTYIHIYIFGRSDST